jgi:hypothetical protein
MFCTNCGTDGQDGAAFCSSCGKATTPQSQGATSPSVTPTQPGFQEVPALAIQAPELLTEGYPTPVATSKTNKTGLIVGLSALGIAVVIGLFTLVGSQKSPFPAALESCAGDDSYATLGDGDKTLILDMEGETEYGMYSEDVFCILEELSIPDSTLEMMYQTTSLDGNVTDSWSGLSATWTYHPDRGMDVILTKD